MLPINIIMQILVHLPYEDVKWVTDPWFWQLYWNRYAAVCAGSKTLEGHTEFVLNPEQQHALGLMEAGHNVFINAPAGTGKSTLVRCFFDKHCATRRIALTSTTGISALHIKGQTLHSCLGIGLGLEPAEQLCERVVKGAKRALWLSLDVLVIDEVSMLHPDLFDKLELMARLIRRNRRPFGGIQIVAVGDLFQLPCISKSGSKLVVDSATFKACVRVVVELTNVVRQTEALLRLALSKVRVGIVDSQVRRVFDARVGAVPDRSSGVQPTMLYCTNRDVGAFNDRQLDKLARLGREFRQYDMNFARLGERLAEHAFGSLCRAFAKHSSTPRSLQICVDAQVMLTANLSTGEGLVNGSRGVVVSFSNEFPVVRFVNGAQLEIAPHSFELHATFGSQCQVVGHAKQIPLKVAYACTVHASQGCTLDFVKVDLSDVFEYGQAYTALSRVKTLSGLFISAIDYDTIKAHPSAICFLNKRCG